MDGDSIIHLVASASEKRSIEATHNDLEDKLVFKTRTEFWGTKRNKSEGYLRELNKERVSKGLDELNPLDFTIVDIQIKEPIENCLNSAKRYILNICEKLDCFDYQVYIGEGETFREKILLPEGRRYKQNRDDLIRALYVPDVKEYLIKHHEAIVIDDIEVDDHLAMIGYANYQRHLTGVRPVDDMDVIIARDKDACGCEGWLYNPDKKDGKPIYISGFGKLWLDAKGKVRGDGRKFKYFQILFGDMVDGYCPRILPEKTVKYGEKSIFKDLNPIGTDEECWQLIVDKYKEWIPEPMTYKAWNNSKVTDNWLTWLQKHFTLVHMRRFEGDDPQVKDILTKLGISINE